MPRSPSPSPRDSRRRSPSPRRDRDRREDRYSDRDPRNSRDRDHRDRRDDRGDRDRRDRDRPRSRSRSRSPPSRHVPRKPKELSFYKKSSVGSFSSRRDPLVQVEETEKERLQRRERGDVPARFGGTREQGVRNTMALPGSAPQGSAPTGLGSFRRNQDPLDRMPGKGGDEYRSGSSRPASGPAPTAAPAGAGAGDKQREARLAAMDKPGAASGARAPRFIEVIANTRMGGKVRVKCLPTDTVGDLKKLIAAQTGTTAQKIVLKKWYTNFKDHVTLQDYEINDGMSLEMY